MSAERCEFRPVKPGPLDRLAATAAKTMKPVATNGYMTNSTTGTDIRKCKDRSNAKGAPRTHPGKGDPTPRDQACGEGNH